MESMVSQGSLDFMQGVLKDKTDELEELKDKLKKLKKIHSYGSTEQLRSELKQVVKEQDRKIAELQHEEEKLLKELDVYRYWYKQVPNFEEKNNDGGSNHTNIQRYNKMNPYEIAEAIRAIYIGNKSVSSVAKSMGRKEKDIQRLCIIVNEGRGRKFLVKNGMTDEEINIVLSRLEGK